MVSYKLYIIYNYKLYIYAIYNFMQLYNMVSLLAAPQWRCINTAGVSGYTSVLVVKKADSVDSVHVYTNNAHTRVGLIHKYHSPIHLGGIFRRRVSHGAGEGC
jgi:hypothetical protein